MSVCSNGWLKVKYVFILLQDGGFLFNRKLRSLLNKTLREDAHYAQRNMAAFAAALRRKCAPGAHFFIFSRKLHSLLKQTLCA